MSVAICPGSYDPVTKGHVNIIRRAAFLFEKVVVAVMVNPLKSGVFSAEERVEMLKICTRDIPNVEVEHFTGLVADYAKVKKANALIKGLRAVSDFEYEFQMAMVNRKLNPELETLFISTDSQHMYLSSSAVRQVAFFDGDISDFVPPEVEGMILERLRPQKLQEEDME